MPFLQAGAQEDTLPDQDDLMAIDVYIGNLAAQYDQSEWGDRFSGPESLLVLKNSKRARSETPSPTGEP